MKNMSFAKTTEQFKNRTKDVTRRNGWWHLKPGEHFMAVEKQRGLQKGEKIVRLGPCECVSNRPEALDKITQDECRREGFPHLTPAQFVEMFCREIGSVRGAADTVLNRIEYKRLD